MLKIHKKRCKMVQRKIRVYLKNYVFVQIKIKDLKF